MRKAISVRRRLGIFVFLFLFQGIILFAQQKRPTITILPFQAVEVPQSVSAVLSTLFETNLVNTGVYTVLSQRERDRILDAQAAFVADFADEAQAIQIGELLSAEQIVIGTVAVLGSKYIINAKIIDVATSETLAAGSINTLSLDELDIACAELTTTLVMGSPGTAGSGAAEAAFDEDQLNFVSFTNLLPENIELLFVSPGDSEYWGPEILGAKRIFAPAEELGFYVHYPDECNLFDIMAVDANGRTISTYGYEICDGQQGWIEFTDDNLSDETTEIDLVTIEIRNDTVPIYYVFISPSDSTMWGADYLGEENVFESDETLNFLIPATSEAVNYDLMAVDEDGDIYRFSFEVDMDSDGLLFPIELSDMQ